jgi:hypothetical protein
LVIFTYNLKQTSYEKLAEEENPRSPVEFGLSPMGGCPTQIIPGRKALGERVGKGKRGRLLFRNIEIG